MHDFSAALAANVAQIIRHCFPGQAGKKALVIYDTESLMSRALGDAYRAALPDATFVDFTATPQEQILAAIDACVAGDLVVMIQSLSFRLSEYRIRIELFQRGLAIIEHVHLERTTSPEQIAAYVDALAYDPEYYLPRAAELKRVIDGATRIQVHCDGTVLTYEGGMEETKLNVGDYRGMKNVGGTFPIGEVFSEPRDFTRLNGEAMIFGFAGKDHLVQIHQPFKIVIEKGILVRHEGPAAFQEVLDQISTEEIILVREFGVGLNPAMGKHRIVDDITAFERQRGLHFSLGEKHGVYKKPGMPAKKTHYHIDIFVDVTRIDADGTDLLAIANAA